MPTSSQEPRGTGLSSSLVTDFRTILSTLEQEKSGRHPDGAEGEEPSFDAAPAPAATRLSRPAGAALPHSLGDVRSRIAALGDISDILASRAPAPEPAAGPKTETAQAARRRSFGSSARQPGDAETRRKRNASKDIITWQRLGVLAVFMAVVGGGAVLLQSLAAREEAKVAPEVIGNAAVASVAPSAQPAATPNVAVAKPLELAGSAIEISVPTPAASSALANHSSADDLPPILLNAAGRSGPSVDPAAGPSGVTAFAAPETALAATSASAEVEDAVEPEAVSADAADEAAASEPAAARPVQLPKAAPLPPVRAPEREVAAATPAAPQEAPAAAAEQASLPAGFGGEPIGTAVTRRAVTMRAAPKKGATPIGNLPGGQKVELVTCQQWCEIIVEGKRAFVYKSFVDTSGVTNAQAAPSGADEAAEATSTE